MKPAGLRAHASAVALQTADTIGAAPASPGRAALRYYGAKWRLAPWIVAHLPPHACYVEPFGGAAGVLLRKPPARYEVYNDPDGDVVGFFRVLRERPHELIRAVERTPFACTEIDLACAPAAPGLDEVERARRIYVRAWQGRHGLPARGRMGWRFERAATRSRTVVDDWRNAADLWAAADRLRRVQIECDDALRVIARFDGPDTLIYADPPYPAATRSERWRQRAGPSPGCASCRGSRPTSSTTPPSPSRRRSGRWQTECPSSRGGPSPGPSQVR